MLDVKAQTPADIVQLLQHFNSRLTEDKATVEEVCLELGLDEFQYYCWKEQFGSLGHEEQQRAVELKARKRRYLQAEENFSKFWQSLKRSVRPSIDHHQLWSWNVLRNTSFVGCLTVFFLWHQVPIYGLLIIWIAVTLLPMDLFYALQTALLRWRIRKAFKQKAQELYEAFLYQIKRIYAAPALSENDQDRFLKWGMRVSTDAFDNAKIDPTGTKDSSLIFHIPVFEYKVDEVLKLVRGEGGSLIEFEGVFAQVLTLEYDDRPKWFHDTETQLPVDASDEEFKAVALENYFLAKEER